MLLIDEQISEPVIQRPSSAARMVAVFPNYGCVTLTTIVVMIPMSRRTCVANATAPRVGNVVLASPITVAFPNGCSVMARTIVGTTAMNRLRIVRPVIQKRISNAATIVVYPSKCIIKRIY